MRVVVGLVALCGCGHIRFDPIGDGGAGIRTDGCTLGAWGAPRPLTELNTPTDEFGPWLSANHLEILFTSGVTGSPEIHRATRATPEATFDPPVLWAPPPNGNSDSDDPWLTSDELRMYFDGHIGSGIQLLFATRATTSAMFANVAQIAELDTSTNDTGPTLTADETTMVFMTDRGGTPDLYMAKRANPTDPFGSPAPIPSASTSSYECCSWISPDGQSLVYLSDAGSPNILHLLIATRSGDDFVNAMPLDPALEAPGPPADPFITPDGLTLVYGVGVTGSIDLYIAERTCQ
jgi:Tol biopolymer transport system component